MKMKGNILIITYWEFDDALIQTYTLPYVRIMKKYIGADKKIFLLTQEKSNVNRREIGNGIIHLPMRYYPFGFRAALSWIGNMIWLFFFILKNKVKTLHAWCTPGGAIGYILSILTRRKLVIDSYEPHAEAMVENGSWKPGSRAFRILFKLEKKQTKRASVLISCTSGMREYANKKYGHFKADFYVKPACVNLELFSPLKNKNQELLDNLGLTGKKIIVYAGKTGGIYFEKEIFDFFREARKATAIDFYLLLLSNLSEEKLKELISESGIPREKIVLKFVAHALVPEYMGLGDLALTPVKPVETKKYCTPIKDGEYWALGLPVIIPQNISDDSGIIKKENAGIVIENFGSPLSVEQTSEIISLLNEDMHQQQLRIRNVAVKYRSFEIAEKIYREVYGK
jgi:hypothetical protein